MPVNRSAAGFPGTANMLANEPRYPIGTAQYASSVDRAVGRIVMWKLNNGQWSRASSCSGTVVGPNIVLTAGHCLTAGWDSYSFIPGLYGDSMPYGEWFAAKTRAWVHEAYNNYVASRSTAQNLLDYGFIKFDPVYNNGYSLSATVGSFQVLMAANLLNTPLYSLGYPVEGFYRPGAQPRRWCLRTSPWCFPYYCSSTAAGQANFGNGWQSVGWGCDSNGGNLGGPVFHAVRRQVVRGHRRLYRRPDGRPQRQHVSGQPTVVVQLVHGELVGPRVPAGLARRPLDLRRQRLTGVWRAGFRRCARLSPAIGTGVKRCQQRSCRRRVCVAARWRRRSNRSSGRSTSRRRRMPPLRRAGLRPEPRTGHRRMGRGPLGQGHDDGLRRLLRQPRRHPRQGARRGGGGRLRRVQPRHRRARRQPPGRSATRTRSSRPARGGRRPTGPRPRCRAGGHRARQRAARRAAAPLPVAGRPMFAGLVGLPMPTDSVGRMWRLAEELREFRGDAHIAAALAAGFDGCELQLLTERCAGMPPRTYVVTRGWDEDQLDAAEAALRERACSTATTPPRPGWRRARQSSWRPTACAKP